MRVSRVCVGLSGVLALSLVAAGVPLMPVGPASATMRLGGKGLFSSVCLALR